MKSNTVNVTEYANDTILGIHSFSDDDEGNKEAEECFKRIIKESGHEVTNEEMEVFLEDGYFEQGNYQVFITHSV